MIEVRKILSFVAVAAFIAFAVLLIYSAGAYPMHFGEPTWYHEARVDCLMKAVICCFVSFASAFAVGFKDK